MTGKKHTGIILPHDDKHCNPDNVLLKFQYINILTIYHNNL